MSRIVQGPRSILLTFSLFTVLKWVVGLGGAVERLRE
jgi:hypothetical protein